MASNNNQLKLKNVMRNDVEEDDDGFDNFELSDEPHLVPVALPAQDPAPAPAPAPVVASTSGGKPYKRKKYNRHTTSQIQELECFFKKCPHPDERQRIELGKKVGMDSKQVKFWFQNRRTQMKTHLERHENVLLKQEFDKLRLENMALKEYIYKPICKECGGDATPISMDEHRLRLDNSRLKNELLRVSDIASKVLGKPVSELVESFLQSELGLPTGESSGLASGGSNSMGAPELEDLIDTLAPSTCAGLNRDKSLYIQVATAAMDELVFLAQNESPYWITNLATGTETFNFDEYVAKYDPYGTSFPGFAYEATRDCASIFVNSLELIDILMQPGRWVDMFPCMVGKASIVSIIENGIDSTHNGEMQLLEAEMLFPSPFVPMRRMRFIRYCKKHAHGAWAVVDISVDSIQQGNGDITRRCKRMPSGFCILQDVTHSFSLVTCVEHVEYDQRVIRQLFRPLVQSGYGFGAHRWLATLQRQCEYAGYLPMSEITPLEASLGLTPQGKKNLLRLSRSTINDFCAGVCNSYDARWNLLNLGDITPSLQVLTRASIGPNGEVVGMVLSFSSALLLPVPRHKVFDFVRCGQLRGYWDGLACEGPMEETIRINKSTNPANCVSILCPPTQNNKDAKMAMLQETWVDKANSVVIYSTVDIMSITQVMEGGDPGFLNLYPSGLVITDAFMDPIDGCLYDKSASSMLTLGFQLLMNNNSFDTSLSLTTVHTVKELMEQTIHKIKVALCCE